MKDILYIGNSDRMIKFLLESPDFCLKKVICEKKKMSQKICSLSLKIPIIGIEDKKQLTEVIADTKITVAIMYDFGIIVPKDIIEKIDVYNFHPGNLKRNRGSSPINWSILLGEQETEMSVYKISDKIDLGILVAAKRCRIYEDDIPSKLRIRLEHTIPELLFTLSEFLKGKFKGRLIEEGIYRRRIVESDYTIDLKKDSISTIKQKIYSQADYKGAILMFGGERQYIRNLKELEKFKYQKMDGLNNKKEINQMKILVSGLLSLHWGRIEYGNIGNYYIVVPLFRKLHEYFPNAEIVTTLQLTDEFCEKENIIKLPWECYYAWRKDSIDTKEALEELAIAEIYHTTGELVRHTRFIDEVLESDLVIDFSGDMWGDNSDGMGENRFLVDLLKFRTVQLLGKKNIMFASSPGPVTEKKTLELAKQVYRNFDLVINREAFSIDIMKKLGFDITNTYSCACPAYLFSENYYPEKVDDQVICRNEGIQKDVKNIGFILATYSLPGHSFDDWSRNDEDFKDYVDLIEHIINEKHERVVLISHSNGFELPPNFKRTHWRDYKMICQLYDILERRGNIDMNYLWKVDNLYYPWEMHTLIGNLDMLISGRVHGAVAGLEQAVPTLAFDYKNGPLAHKMYGFFEVIGMEEWVISREDFDFVKYFDRMYDNLETVSEKLRQNYDAVVEKVEEGFRKIKELMEE